MTDVVMWPPGSQQSIGQAGEFLVWSHLITQSGGGLHVFLPALDRGLDAVVHRLSDGRYIAVQVKTHVFGAAREAPLAVLESHVYTDDQLIIGVNLAGDGLGPYALVADGRTFRDHAAVVVDRGRRLLVADMPVEPVPGHRWSEQLVPIERLAARVAGAEPSLVVTPPTTPDVALLIGTIGELEVMRRGATLEDCALFRPFPDLETAEVLVRRLASGATAGLQVKTAELTPQHDMRHVLIHRSSFRPSPTTFVVATAWIVPERRFHPTCLLIPSEVVPDIAGLSGEYFELHFRPDASAEPSRLDRYRLPLESLADRISDLLS
ncbi:MAG TPA: hypothetical protein VFB69_01540 [Candidatus Dormibacteraeota bacterium]|nr:hypothetical protein [Candidatus Dormibacteraeota bacterium]